MWESIPRAAFLQAAGFGGKPRFDVLFAPFSSYAMLPARARSSCSLHFTSCSLQAAWHRAVRAEFLNACNIKRLHPSAAPAHALLYLG
ncbi:MAG TPA: hypothetical protein VKU82_00365 [Planctomycetaceae bacterium]|nr:hypothetical protein [Planctomycetaceae bacterium]